MTKRKPAGPLKSFNNLDEVLDRMFELRFFGGYEALKEAKADINSQNWGLEERTDGYWYSNGVIEVKIFRQMFGSYELCNYKLASHEDLDSLFELAETRGFAERKP